ncbi:MAG: DUF1552 domain-containing protein [Planctomycetota bacterium]
MSSAPSRRAFLRAAGACVALPFLPSFGRAAAAAPSSARPRRTVFLYVPNGVNREAWTPKAEGALATLPPTLSPLAPFTSSLRLLGGLGHQKANANGDGPGDHARAAATFLTASQAQKVGGVRVGVSIDQVIAQRIGGETAFPSLELSCDPGGVAGECDSGYSCAYSGHVSWKSATLPMAKETNPASLFDRLFTDQGGPGTPEEKARRRRKKRSVLDLVLGEAQALAGRVDAEDRRRVDEYLEGVRALEQRIARGEAQGAPGLASRPKGPPQDHAEHFAQLADLLVLALRADLTRTATLMIANEGSNRSYPSVGVPDGHHGISHHGNDPTLRQKIAKVDRFHVERLAHLLAGLAGVPEGAGTLLDSTLVLYGSGIGDGNRHDHEDLPILLAGAPTAGLAGGVYKRFPPRTPLANLFSSIALDATGERAELGDATGTLTA